MEKLNIAELLRDCPTGMELDCTICDNVYFDEVTPNMIKCFVKNDVYNTIYFHHDGTYLTAQNAKCVIFPKGKTTWEGFQRPFKDGDVLIKDNKSLCIYKSIHKTYKGKSFIDFYCGYRPSDNQLIIKESEDSHFGFISEAKLATEEEKQKLFDTIRANGYKWNPETKTLEKLEVSKFDITTLKPFDKILTRDGDKMCWYANIYSHYLGKDKLYQFRCMGTIAKQCIPYKGNEHLLGTKNDCDEYYKTWE